jgi:pyrroline-5-carboxylate reductase
MKKDILSNTENKEIIRGGNNLHIGVVGLGNMGTAAVEAFVRTGVVDAATVMVSNRSEGDTKEKLAAKDISNEHLLIAENNDAVVRSSAIVFVALKQQKMKEEFERWRELHLLQEEQLIVSFAAGVTTKTMARWLGNDKQALARVMPNTPVASGRGVLGWYINGPASNDQRRELGNLLESIGTAIHVDDEEQIDLITALSGSGPAYFYRLAEEMIDFGIEQGFSADRANKIVRETLIGAAAHLDKTGKDLAQLRREITSPNGTTEAGMNTWDEVKTDEGVFAVADAAYQRSKAIGTMFEAE